MKIKKILKASKVNILELGEKDILVITIETSILTKKFIQHFEKVLEEKGINRNKIIIVDDKVKFGIIKNIIKK